MFCGSCHDAFLQSTDYFYHHSMDMDSLTQIPHTLFCLLINIVPTEVILLGVNILMLVGLYVVENEDSSRIALRLAQNK